LYIILAYLYLSSFLDLAGILERRHLCWWDLGRGLGGDSGRVGEGRCEESGKGI